jgi:heat shock protein HtpX
MTQSNLNAKLQRRYNFRNALHTAIIVLGSAALLGLIAWTLFGTFGLIVAMAVSIVGMATLGRVSPTMVLGLYKARPLSPDELPEIHDVVQKLAARANLPKVPKLYYVPSKVLNAFAVGSRDDAAIAVTDGIIRAMNLRQLTGILAHETAHIQNGDLRVMGMADVLNRITSFICTLGLLGVPLLFGVGVNMPIFALGLMIAAPTLGGLLQMALSRAREYDADLDGATLTGDPEGLALALKDLEEKQSGKWEGLVLPGGRMPQPSLLRSHPHTQDRVARLLALRINQDQQIVVAETRTHPSRSIVPPLRNPRIHWQRMGIYS